MFNGFPGRQRVAPLAERRTAERLREALAALPAPWIVLASRRVSGADGPPWVRFLGLHPEKGIALVDTESVEAAVAPLEDFLARTGFAALRAGALPIVSVAVGAGEVGIVAELLDKAFAPKAGTLGNPNWCEAVVELLLGAPDLMLSKLRRTPSAVRPAASRSQSPTMPRQHDVAPGFPLPEPAVRPPRGVTPPRRVAEPPRAETGTSPGRSQHVEPSLSSPPQSEPPQPHRVTQAEPPPRLVPRRVLPVRSQEPESEDVRLVPRRIAPAVEAPCENSASKTVPFGGDDRVRQARQRASAGSGRVEPHFSSSAEPQFSLEADEPIIPLRQTAASRQRQEPSLRAGGLRADSALADWQPRRRHRWPYAAAVVLLLGAVGAIALWYREVPPPQAAAVGNAPSIAAVTPQTPTKGPTSAPTPPASASTQPSQPTTPPPVQTAATPKPASAAPHATADELPRAMLQPKIASASPPLPLPLPEAKLMSQKPVHVAAAKPEAASKTAAAKPATPKPATKVATANSAPEHNLPAPIAAVLYPNATAQHTAPSAAAPSASHASTAPSTRPTAPAAPAASATALVTPASGSSASPPSGTVTVNGITYVNGEQPRSLGSLTYSSSPPSPAPAAGQPASTLLAPNGPTATVPTLAPNEVVISRAPSASPIMPAVNGVVPPTSNNSGYSANGAPREITISRAPSTPSVPAANAATPTPDAPPPGGAYAVPSNTTPPYAASATGTPQSIQSAPLSGSSP